MYRLNGGLSSLVGLGATNEECCKNAMCTGIDGKKFPAGMNVAGRIICCDGRVIPCAYDNHPEDDALTLELRRRATLVHEGQHAIDAKKSRAPCQPNEIGCATVPNLAESECKAYAAELPWLEKGYDECATDYCRNEFDRQIRFTVAAQNNSAHKPCFNPVDGREGDWLKCYCDQAGMGIPADAQRVVDRWRGMKRPPTMAPRNITVKGAPILEIPEYTEKPRSISFAAPTIEYVLGDEYIPPKFPPMKAVKGGRPDSSGKCPDGWSYASIDGKFGCRNNATGEFRTVSGDLMNGLSALAGLGATKKKKAPKSGKRTPVIRKQSLFSGVPLVKIGAGAGAAGAAYLATKSPVVALAIGVGAYFITGYLTRDKDFEKRSGPAVMKAGTREYIPNY